MSLSRRLFLTAAAAGSATLLCPAGRAVGRRLRIGFVNPGRRTDQFWRMAGGVMQAAATRLDIDLTMFLGERDRALIIAQGEALVASRPDYLVLVNEHRTALPILKAAMAAKIPVLMAFSGLAPEDKMQFAATRAENPGFLGSLLTDNHGAGGAMASALITACRGLTPSHSDPVSVIALSGLVATPAGKERSEGMVQTIREYGAQLLDQVQVNWSRDEAYDRTLSLLRRQPQVTGIWCANDDMALGAMEAADQLGRRPGQDLHVVGMNWQDDALAEVAKGRLLLSMGGHFLLGAWALAWLRDMADGMDFAHADGMDPLLNPAALTRKQVAPYLERLGHGGWQKLDYAQFRHGGSMASLSVASLLTSLGISG